MEEEEGGRNELKMEEGGEEEGGRNELKMEEEEGGRNE